MRLAIAALAVSLGATTVFLACSSSDGTVSPTTDGGTSSSSGSSSGKTSSSSGQVGEGGVNPQAGDDFAAIDGGCLVATNVTCVLHCTGYQTAGTIASTPRTDLPAAVAWSNTANATTADGQFATVTLNDGEESAYLDATNFNFTLDDTKQTYGIAVEFMRESVGVVLDQDFTVLIASATTMLPVNHMDQGIWPTTQIGTHHYGQCVDTWQVDLNPSDVRKPSFGARVAVKRGPDAGAGPVTANVDSMRVNVCYCNADGK